MTERKKLSRYSTEFRPRKTRSRIGTRPKPADDLKPLPSGEYRCSIASGELFNAKTGTAGYKLKLVVVEGEHADRVVWHDVWLSEAALPMAKRDLGKLGITSLEQLEQPLPEGIIVNAKVALRKNDDGTEYNRVTRFDVVAIESPEPEPFAPRPTELAERRLDEPTPPASIGRTGQAEQEVPNVMTDLDPSAFASWGIGPGDGGSSIGEPPSPPMPNATPKRKLEREAYLSHFVFGQDFAEYLKRERTEKGYNGPCGADWLFWDIDRPDDLGLALRDARRLAGAILDRYRELDEDDLLIFLSGGKGVHVGIPTVWHPEPSPHFNVIAKLFCLRPGGRGEARHRWLDLLEDAALPGAEFQAPEDRALQAPALARRTDSPEARSRSSSWLGIPSPSRFPAGRRFA